MVNHLNNLDDEMAIITKSRIKQSSSNFVLKDMNRFTVEQDKYEVIKNKPLECKNNVYNW